MAKETIVTEIDEETGGVGPSKGAINPAGDDDESPPQKKAQKDDDDYVVEVYDDADEPPRKAEPKKKADGDDGDDDASLSEEPTEEELKGYSKSVRDRINRLTYQRHEERRRAEQAEREREIALEHARRLNGEVDRYRTVVTESEGVLVRQMKDRATAELERAKDKYRAAYEAGDTDAMMAANEAITKAHVDLSRLAGYRPRQAPQGQQGQQGQPQGQQPQPARQAQPQKPQISEAEAKWLRENPWFMSDDEMTSFAYGVDTTLQKRGVRPSTPEYFAAIDKRMREVFPDRFSSANGGQQPPAANRGGNAVVAPATRPSGGSPRTVRLSQSEMNVVKRLGITPKQYIDEKMKGQGNG